MAFDLAKEHLARLGLDHHIRVLEESSATVDLAAKALGCEGKRIAKSLSFKVGEKAILVVMAGDAKLDNPKYKARFGTKATMLTPEEAVELVGHAVGGVCPFGIKPDVKVYLDESLKRFDFVYPACGSANSAVKLTLDELERACGDAEWIDVGKNWQERAV
ncbi:MAG: YbaK/EbsC family protein [Ruminococcaceae bacterium]|nr:YbaK/EbsC family protein [Oscillospiraceae bacterium]